jgi:hypothetical protein
MEIGSADWGPILFVLYTHRIKQRLFYMGEAIPRFALMIGSLHTNMGHGIVTKTGSQHSKRNAVMNQ